MAFAPHLELGHNRVRGYFTEKECSQLFEYSEPRLGEVPPFGEEYGMKVWVGNDANFRWAKILKTVAYIVVDEDSDGSPITEWWELKRHRVYAKQGT
jgi:hypothetical protein